MIDTKKGRATEGMLISVTPNAGGFGFRQMANLLNAAKVTPPLLAHVHEEDNRDGLSIVAAALVRGQGKTEGLHRRVVRTSRMEEIDELTPHRALDRIGSTAQRRAEEAGEAAQRLRRALMLLVQGGPDQARLDDDAAKKKVEPWMVGLNDRIDREFFDQPFWDEAADDSGDHRLAWRQRLRALAQDVFAAAAEAAPRTAMRRVRAIARARSMLEGQMDKWIKEVA